MSPRRRRTGRDVGPRPIADALEEMLASMGPRRRADKPADLSTIHALFARWDELVGPLAEHARPVRIEGDTLVVAVDHPVWASAMKSVSGPLLERLAESGRSAPTAVSVVVRRP